MRPFLGERDISQTNMLPDDLFNIFAEFGGSQVAICLACTCKLIKKCLDESYPVPVACRVTEILDPSRGFGRRPGAVGKYTRVVAINREELSHLPYSVTKVKIQPSRSLGDLSKIKWPTRLRSIEFVNYFNQPLSEISWPPQLRFLDVGAHFSQPTFQWPKSLTHLCLGSSFDFPVANLPEKLQSLTLSTMEFRSPIVSLPPNLRVLRLASRYESPLPSLPSTLTHLDLGGYTGPLADLHWPSQLQVLHLGRFVFNQTFEDLPDTLKELNFGDTFNGVLPRLPSGLKVLRFRAFDQPLQLLPQQLTELFLGDHFNQPVDQLCLPESLRVLVFGTRFNQPVYHLKWPAGLKSLVFGRDFNQHVEGLPDGLTHLTFGYRFNRPIFALPPALQALTFGHWFDQPLPTLPADLQYLAFGHYFNQPISNMSPNIREIVFGDSLNQNINLLTQCKKLIQVRLGVSFRTYTWDIPGSLRLVQINKRCQRLDHHRTLLAAKDFQEISEGRGALHYAIFKRR